MYDRFDRKIDYLRISVTDLCNLRCYYCMPEEGVLRKRHDEILSLETIVQVARAAASLGIEKIRLTGGEPLVRRGLTFLVEELKKVPGIREVSLSTNGTLLPGLAGDLKKAGLDRLNISLDSLNSETYRAITRIGRLEAALEGIEAAIGAGFSQVKINMVLIPKVNDLDVPAMKSFCLEKGLMLQRINHYALSDIGTMERGYEAERPLACADCNRIRLTADGKLKPCLFSDLEIPVDPDRLETSLRRAIMEKPACGTSCTARQNWQIGG
jgi:cyclic pyranopterin phosphate synthase